MEDIGFLGGELWLPRVGLPPLCGAAFWVVVYDDGGKVVQSIGFMRDLTASTMQSGSRASPTPMSLRDCPTDCCCHSVWKPRLRMRRSSLVVSPCCFGSRSFQDHQRFVGASFGDRVLQLVAERLQTCLRQTDMLCRLGGDEFVIYLHGEMPRSLRAFRGAFWMRCCGRSRAG